MMIRERIDEVLREQLGTGYEWTGETPLVEGGLKLDSLDSVELIMRLEEEFQLQIPDDTCDALPGLTVGGLADWIEQQLNAKPALLA